MLETWKNDSFYCDFHIFLLRQVLNWFNINRYCMMEQRNWHKANQTHQYCMMMQRNWHKASQTHQSMKYLLRTRFATLRISNFLSLLRSFLVVLYCLGYRNYQVVKNLIVSTLLQFLSI